MIPKGKGIYIWYVKTLLKIYGSFDAIADEAVRLGFRHIELKVTNGAFKYNLKMTPTGWKDVLVPPLVKALQARGIKVYGWGYVYPNLIDRTANTIADRVIQLGLDGFVVNAEAEFKGERAKAGQLAGRLRKLLPNTILALSSYRFPDLHRTFPFGEFMNMFDFHNQQLYWAGKSNPAQQLGESISQLTPYANKPFVPIGFAYTEHGFMPKPPELWEFAEETIKLNLPGYSFWEWWRAHQIGLMDVIKDLPSQEDVPIEPPAPPPKSPDIQLAIDQLEGVKSDIDIRIKELEK